MVIFWAIFFMAILYLPAIILRHPPQRSINIATWTEMLDEEFIQNFERTTGISVHISYFDNNDELLVKLYATGGKGYDLVIPSDYAVQELIAHNLLQPLDKSKLTVWDRIIPQLLNGDFDPGNTYSIPYFWGIYGIGMNQEFFSEQNIDNVSWDLVFNPVFTHISVALNDSPKEVILFAALYLFGNKEQYNSAEFEAIKQLLIQQKRRVVAYTEFRADYLLLSDACPLAVIASPQMLRLAAARPHMSFSVPHEGTFSVLDSWVIPRTSTKADFVYDFLNFLFQPENIAHHFYNLVFLPATVDIHYLLQQHPAGKSIYDAHMKSIKKLIFFRNIVPQDVLNDIWISLKS